MLVLLPVFFLVLVSCGWVLYTFLSYRRGRQEEVLELMIVAIQSQAPLPAALRSYVLDRPRGALRATWVGLLLFPVVFVVAGYYFLWHRRHSFDCKVLQLADDLQEGLSLSESLQMSGGVVSREAMLAVTVGESTGRLPVFLRQAQRSSFAPVLLEALPRFLYPVVVLFAICVMASLYNVLILPRMRVIFREMNMRLPALTQQMYDTPAWTTGVWFFVLLFLIVVPLLTIQLIVLPRARWHFPFLGGVYRNFTLGWGLRMLGALLEAGQSVPAALELLIGSGYFVKPAKDRLAAAQAAIEGGEPLAEALRRSKVVRSTMAPLIQAAERANNLPWALSQLGESRANRAVRWLRRVSLVFSPASTIAVGTLVGLLVLGGFLPLLDLINMLAR